MLTIDPHHPLLPKTPRRFEHLIDGAWRQAQGPNLVERASPAHEVPVTAYPAGTAADAEAAVMAARRAFDTGPWPKLKAAERSRVLLRAADLIERRAEELALLDTLECGKPLAQARGEVAAAADIWRYAAALARDLHGDAYANLGDAMLGVVVREPMGVVAIITPWNFPFLIVSQKLPFALVSWFRSSWQSFMRCVGAERAQAEASDAGEDVVGRLYPAKGLRVGPLPGAARSAPAGRVPAPSCATAPSCRVPTARPRSTPASPRLGRASAPPHQSRHFVTNFWRRTLAAGCTAVVKPSELTSGSTLVLGEILLEAGVPPGVANIVTGYGRDVGAIMVRHPAVDMISFTGSTAVGKMTAGVAAETLKRISMELGGKNPQLVFADADLEAAIDAVIFGIYFNAGECCNSGSRLLVQREIAETFVGEVVARSRDIPIGDPLDERTKVGAIISSEHLGKIESYVSGAADAGAEIRLGGQRLATERGRFMAPTVVTGITPKMAIAREEVFGPVLSVLTFDTVDEAITLANATSYGLSAGVWSRDYDTCLKAGRGIRAGTVWLNTFMDGFAELPFGGFGESGIGRELGRHAVLDYTEVKTLQMHNGPRTNWWLPSAEST